ncbi:SLT domain-containing protein [Hyphomicrobiales bacterium]|jgi:soluble lytic murein transglycosylase-like protein|nr:SLT domain-containing protein [Hyphomicrobiales bacterium]CAH1702385.1 Transglycosylase SLT domain protein [Hyphomicrobiales bacterium]CAI0346585.1 soluble lytic murein transglycosylase [Hyphomicrobiales bacterium]
MTRFASRWILACVAVLTIAAADVSPALANWLKVRDAAMTLRERGRSQEAYELVAQTGVTTVAHEVDRSFIAGFLALRVLGRHDLALAHFKNMAVMTARLRPSDDPAGHRAMAGYWLGRTLQVMGQADEAKTLYTTAAMYRNTFYGLLAASQAGLSDTRAAIAPAAPAYPRPQLFWHDPRMNSELVLAIIKTESNFRTTAVSSAGALGDMQLMPGTVKAISRKTGVPLDPRMVASNRNYNVAVGSHHFADLLAKYAGNVTLAAAAYNAGSGASDGWIARFGDPRTNSIDIVDWIELIPFRETRGYVKKVVSNYVAYLSTGTSSVTASAR